MTNFISAYIGSVVGSLADPDHVYWEKCFSYERWNIIKDYDSLEEIYLIRKIVLDLKERVFWWIEQFQDIFPEHIIEDAKRIAFDVKEKKFLASTLAVVCIKIACDFHGVVFSQYKPVVLNRVRKLKRERTKKDLFVVGNRYFSNIYKFAERIKEQLGKEKFERLKDMWGGLNVKFGETNTT